MSRVVPPEGISGVARHQAGHVGRDPHRRFSLDHRLASGRGASGWWTCAGR